MKILEFEIEVVAPNGLVPNRPYDDCETHDLLGHVQKVLFVEIGEWIWGEDGVKETMWHDMKGAKIGWQPQDGFNEEHKRSILVDTHIMKDWQYGSGGFESSWQKVDEHSKNIKMKVELGACDDTIDYDLLQASTLRKPLGKESMVVFLRGMRRKIRAELLQYLFLDCVNDDDLSSVSVTVRFPKEYYKCLPDVPQWMKAQPSRSCRGKENAPKKGKKKRT